MRARLFTTICAIMLGGLCLLPVVARAQSYGLDETLGAINSGPEGEILPKTVAGKSTVPQVIGAIVGVGLSLVGLAFFALTLYAGFRWMIAMGNTEDVEKAKETLIAAIIGLGIVLAAYAVTSFVFSNLGPKTTTTESAPPSNTSPFPATCTNGVKDDNETDIDCGGECGATCGEGKACQKSLDCLIELNGCKADDPGIPEIKVCVK